MLVLLIEDDPDYAGIIAETARYEGHHVVVVGTEEAARRFMGRETPELAIVDVMLPDGSGLNLIPEMREQFPRLPILVLSSLAGLTDITRGLDAGADDYVAKPFHPSELRARIRALARRAGAQETPASDSMVSPLDFDWTAGIVRYRGRDIGCTELEARILGEFVRVPDQVLPYAYLNQRVWKYPNLQDATLLKGHISAIRRKLRDAGCPGEPIRTISRVGYAFAPEGLVAASVHRPTAEESDDELCAS
ncbi:MAG: response regulator transcription factor [Dehalococcoidia bacterium]|nr:response regulator transcription factor [Dehalococcoidia bacterium]